MYRSRRVSCLDGFYPEKRPKSELRKMVKTQKISSWSEEKKTNLEDNSHEKEKGGIMMERIQDGEPQNSI